MTTELRQKRIWEQTWKSNQGADLEVNLELDEVRVQHFRNLNRAIWSYSSYCSFWVWKGCHNEFESIVNQLSHIYLKQFGIAPKLGRHYANFLKEFTNSFPYQYDDRSIGYIEYGKFPIEVLYDKEGDCECLSLLLVSILAHAGFQVALLIGYTKPNHKGCHASVGLLIESIDSDDIIEYKSNKYLYCEAVSSDQVGKCAFPFDIFKKDPIIKEVARDYKWDGQPPGWRCNKCSKVIEPWIEKCPTCNEVAVFTKEQYLGDEASDWDRILVKFIDYIGWIKRASLSELGYELEKISLESNFGKIPTGNRNYFEKTLKAMSENDDIVSNKYLVGVRNHLLSAWPHIVASVFCHKPKSIQTNEKVDNSLRWLGMSIYEMDNNTLAQFAHKILLDTTCKRIKGFSGGSRLAIGRILSTYENKGEIYMSEKRKSIENILVKVVMPQAFSLLSRELTRAKDLISSN